VQACPAICNYQKNIPLIETKLGHYWIVLRIPWLQPFNVCLLFIQNKMIFDSNYCLTHYIDHLLLIQGMTQDPSPMYLDSNARPFRHTVFDTQETWKLLPPEYHSVLVLFLKEGSGWQPPKWAAINHKINHKPDFHPRFESLYRLLQAELKAWKEWLDDNLEKRFMQPLSPLTACTFC
jgi:hypothetical protein